jgi:hypothetical protein
VLSAERRVLQRRSAVTDFGENAAQGQAFSGLILDDPLVSEKVIV